MSESDLTAPQRMISSCTGAVITSLTMTPFDVVKTRLQAQQKAFLKHKCYLYCNGLMEHVCYLRKGEQHWFDRPGRYRGTWDAMVKISATEGLPALWSGLPPTLAMAVPSTVLYFTSYDIIKQNLQSGRFSTPVESALISGALSRTLTVLAISPLELVRTKMQSQRLSYSQLAAAVRLMVQQQGVRSLYMGLTSTLLRDVPFSCIYWSTYEFLKRTNGSPSLAFCLVAGATAGSAAAITTLPFDVIKTHRQLELGEALTKDSPRVKDPLTMLSDLYRMSGVRGLFTGLVPRLARVAPACAIMITTYEAFKAHFVRKMQASSYTLHHTSAAAAATGDHREVLLKAVSSSSTSTPATTTTPTTPADEGSKKTPTSVSCQPASASSGGGGGAAAAVLYEEAQLVSATHHQQHVAPSTPPSLLQPSSTQATSIAISTSIGEKTKGALGLPVVASPSASLMPTVASACCSTTADA